MSDRRQKAQSSTQHVYLTGFSGSGKSLVGPLLAKRLGARCVDVDAEIERMQKKSVSQVFAERGEEAFRRLEQGVIEHAASAVEGQVVALGGGALLAPKTRATVRRSGILVYLRCARRELVRRLRGQTDRPLLMPKPEPRETINQARARRIAELLTEREPLYRQAEIVVSVTSRSPEQVAEILAHKLAGILR